MEEGGKGSSSPACSSGFQPWSHCLLDLHLFKSRTCIHTFLQARKPLILSSETLGLHPSLRTCPSQAPEKLSPGRGREKGTGLWKLLWWNFLLLQGLGHGRGCAVSTLPGLPVGSAAAAGPGTPATRSPPRPPQPPQPLPTSAAVTAAAMQWGQASGLIATAAGLERSSRPN